MTLIIISRVLMLLINLALLAFGAFCLYIGVTLRTSKGVIVQKIKNMDAENGGISMKLEIDAAATLNDLSMAMSKALCFLGGFVVSVSCSGFLAAAVAKPITLYFHFAMLALLIGLHVFGIVMLTAFRSSIKTRAQDAYLELQNTHYIPLSRYMNSRNFSSNKIAVSHLINTIQIWFECCGAKRLGDITQSKSWKSYNRTWKDVKLARPMTCCKLFDPKEKENVMKPKFDMHQLRDYLLDPDCPFAKKMPQKVAHNRTCPDELVKYATKKWSSPLINLCVLMIIVRSRHFHVHRDPVLLGLKRRQQQQLWMQDVCTHGQANLPLRSTTCCMGQLSFRTEFHHTQAASLAQCKCSVKSPCI